MDYQLVLKTQYTPADLIRIMKDHIGNHNGMLGPFAVSSDSVMFSGKFISHFHVMTYVWCHLTHPHIIVPK